VVHTIARREKEISLDRKVSGRWEYLHRKRIGPPGAGESGKHFQSGPTEELAQQRAGEEDGKPILSGL